MKVGFTGTREETTCEQHAALCNWLRDNLPAEFHHGCCVGADSEAVEAVGVWVRPCRVIAHPPTNRGMVSFVAEEDSDQVLPAKPYLDRNRDIVDAADILLACPRGPEETRSGTWSTVRYARRCGKRIVVIWPDGKVTEEGK